MTRSLGHVIADSLQLSLGYAERLLKDIPAQQFGRFAAPGGTLVESNHPAFTYGHLSLYGPRILTHLGRPSLSVPAGFEALFSKDAKCVDDPAGTIYPSMDVITKAFFDGYRSARLPANLLQAQRDYFGAHTYERTDKPRGQFFHTNWTGRGGDTSSSTFSV